ncbi:PAP2 superfamily-domain-containing protein [Chytriomyces sp. MP71]|nr:PAP2 superfamily-domain-containing protein [Chytriomyces sp. MP71]
MPAITSLLQQHALDTAGIGALFLVAFVAKATPPFLRTFDVNDPDIAHPRATSNAFPTWSLFFVAFAGPVCILALAAYVAQRTGGSITVSNGAEDIRPFCVLFAVNLGAALALTTCATHVLKLWVGRLRPDFLARCQPTATSAASHSPYSCAGDPRQVVDGRRSFPSGHASFACAAAVLTALVLASMLGIWRTPTRRPSLSRNIASDDNDDEDALSLLERAAAPDPPTALLAPPLPTRRVRFPHHLGRSVWALILVASPLLFAAFVAITRVRENMHHPTDVIAGALLGMFCSCFVYASRMGHAL